MTDEKHGKEEEDLNNYVDMGKDEAIHKHEDEDIDEEVQIDGGAEIVQKRVGPFKIRHHILDMGQCQILSSLFDEVEDRTVATVKDADRFMIKRSEFWSSLSPEKEVSNMLINYVTEVLNIRQIIKGDVKRWYFPTYGQNYRILLDNPGVKRKRKPQYYIRIKDFSSLKQVIFY